MGLVDLAGRLETEIGHAALASSETMFEAAMRAGQEG
jgi:hypothetical protein